MESKGNKIIYYCPECGSTDIVNTGKGLCFTIHKEEESCTRWLPKNHYHCWSCESSGKWKKRGKTNRTNPNVLFHINDDGDVYMVKPLSPPEQPKPKAKTPPSKPRKEQRVFPEERKGKWFNHRPDWFGVWVDYNEWRFKDQYNILLENGMIVYSVYPNGCGWYSGIGDWHDADVLKVCLTERKDFMGWRKGCGFTDDYRKNHNAEMFSDGNEEILQRWRDMELPTDDCGVKILRLENVEAEIRYMGIPFRESLAKQGLRDVDVRDAISKGYTHVRLFNLAWPIVDGEIQHIDRYQLNPKEMDYELKSDLNEED